MNDLHIMRGIASLAEQL